MNITKYTLIHYHIYKNAGTSFDSILNSSFPKSWAKFDGLHEADVVDHHRLRKFIDQNPDLEAISSHLARPPLPHANCFGVCFLRHPLDRAVSVYKFARKDSSQVDHEDAKTLSFDQFIQSIIEKKIINSVGLLNYQTIHLSKASFRKETIYNTYATEDDLYEAKELISSPAFFAGAVCFFERSVELLRSRLRGNLAKLVSGNIRLNFDDPLHGSDESGLRAYELGLSNKNRLDFLSANEFDLKLYQFARSQIEANI